MLTFSNYQTPLQGAILAVRALKQAMSNGNHNLDGKDEEPKVRQIREATNYG